jgi:hypothetical protein
MNCWICGAKADSHEHTIKKSDLKSTFPNVSQKQPLFYSDDQIKNLPVNSLKSDCFMSPTKICKCCNNSRTQPHDRAWEQFSSAMRLTLKQPTLPKSVHAKSIFKYDTHHMMLNVHLYFIKLFGCHIATEKIPIDLAGFSSSIMNNKAHPNVYLGFWRIEERVGMSNIEAEIADNGDRIFVTWFYEIDNLAVNVMYASPGEKREGLVNAWHPRFGTNRPIMHKLD